MSDSRSSFFAAQNVQDPESITLPRLGPINKRQAPVHFSRDGWAITHDSASVLPEIALPRGARKQNNDATPQVRLPPVSDLIAEVDACIAGQLGCAVTILTPHFPGPSKSITSPHVVIDCQSLVSRNVPGFPLYEIGNWTRPAINLLHGITEFEVERRLASVHPPLIGFCLAGYSHLNLAISLSKHHKCRTVPDLVLHVGAICQRFVTKYCNDYRGPEGIRVGPGHVPLECVRMIRVVQMTENYWIGVLVVNLLR